LQKTKNRIQNLQKVLHFLLSDQKRQSSSQLLAWFEIHSKGTSVQCAYLISCLHNWDMLRQLLTILLKWFLISHFLSIS
jgi:ferritin-like metal-binding protein YciE